MKTEKEKNTIVVLFDEHREITDVADPNDSWDRDNDSIDVEFKELRTEHPKRTPRGCWPHEIEVDFDPEKYVNKELGMVVVRYSTGDTFGSTEGAWTIVGIFTDLVKAEKIAVDIENDNYGNNNAWQGYFESLECADVKYLTLRR